MRPTNPIPDKSTTSEKRGPEGTLSILSGSAWGALGPNTPNDLYQSSATSAWSGSQATIQSGLGPITPKLRLISSRPRAHKRGLRPLMPMLISCSRMVFATAIHLSHHRVTDCHRNLSLCRCSTAPSSLAESNAVCFCTMPHRCSRCSML